MLHLQQQMTCLDWIIDSAGQGVPVPEPKNLADYSTKFKQIQANTINPTIYNLKMKRF